MANRKRTKKIQLIFVIVLIIMLTLSLSSSIIIHLTSGGGNQNIQQKIQQGINSTGNNQQNIDFDVNTGNINITTGEDK